MSKLAIHHLMKFALWVGKVAKPVPESNEATGDGNRPVPNARCAGRLRETSEEAVGLLAKKKAAN
jgi:hypothetical protein